MTIRKALDWLTWTRFFVLASAGVLIIAILGALTH